MSEAIWVGSDYHYSCRNHAVLADSGDSLKVNEQYPYILTSGR